MFEGVTNAIKRLSQWSKDNEDKNLGWHFDEVKSLTVKKNDLSSIPLYAETHQEDSYGFNPKSAILRVRLEVDLDEDKGEWLLGGDDGYSLYEGEQLFGKEGGWKIVRAFARGARLDLFFEC